MDRVVDHGQTVIEQGSKSFAAAARLFDPETRGRAYMLYAWCRHCDDQTDDQVLGFDGSQLSPEEGRARVDRLQEQTRRALSGEATDDPIFAGLQRVVAASDMPHRYPMEHLEGFAMDVAGREYRTLDDTVEYCYHVAGVVGIMMAYIMGVRDEPTLDRATDLGLAFQLTNICRDVLEDAEVGRVYLPRDWLAEAGVPADGITRSEHRAGVFEVVHLEKGKGRPLPIQKILSAPLASDVAPFGVVQISRKGEKDDTTLPDFSNQDLEQLKVLCSAIAKHLA